MPPPSCRPLWALTGTRERSWAALVPSLLLSSLHLLLLPSRQPCPTRGPVDGSTPGSPVLPCLPACSDSHPLGRRCRLTVSSSAAHCTWQPDRACETRDGPERGEMRTTSWGLQSPSLTALPLAASLQSPSSHWVAGFTLSYDIISVLQS